jgi:Fe-S cluster biogenesis protein NfuA
METVQEPVKIIPGNTPNPMSIRFSVNRKLLDGPGRDFPNAASAKGSPLAAEVFKIHGVAGVFVGTDFVTVTAGPGASTLGLTLPSIRAIEWHLGTGLPAVEGETVPAAVPARSQLETSIRELLDAEIRPAVAMDGGDITYEGFENGVVKLHLRGACRSCPSSIWTLKAGIEMRLKEKFPEVKSVEAV